MTSICSSKLVNKKPKKQTVVKTERYNSRKHFSLQLRTEMLGLKYFSIQHLYFFLFRYGVVSYKK